MTNIEDFDAEPESDELDYYRDRLSCGCCSCCGCDCSPPEDEEDDEVEESIMPLRDADPVGYERALVELLAGSPPDALSKIKFFEHWKQAATSEQIKRFLQRRVISEMWDATEADLTREERLWLTQEFISPANLVSADLVLAALRAGYERGRKGGPR